MNSWMDRARIGLASARTRHGLTEAKLRELQPSEQAYKVSDVGDGLYVIVSPSGSRSFRYDYRLCGRRETLRDADRRGATSRLRVLPSDRIWLTAWMWRWRRRACCWLGTVSMSVPGGRQPGPRSSSAVKLPTR